MDAYVCVCVSQGATDMIEKRKSLIGLACMCHRYSGNDINQKQHTVWKKNNLSIDNLIFENSLSCLSSVCILCLIYVHPCTFSVLSTLATFYCDTMHFDSKLDVDFDFNFLSDSKILIKRITIFIFTRISW